MHPRIVRKQENVARGPEVVSRWVKADWTDWKIFFWMLSWETASMFVLLGNKSEKATATKYIFLIFFSVLSKFYEKMNKRLLLFSAHLK